MHKYYIVKVAIIYIPSVPAWEGDILLMYKVSQSDYKQHNICIGMCILVSVEQRNVQKTYLAYIIDIFPSNMLNNMHVNHKIKLNNIKSINKVYSSISFFNKETVDFFYKLRNMYHIPWRDIIFLFLPIPSHNIKNIELKKNNLLLQENIIDIIYNLSGSYELNTINKLIDDIDLFFNKIYTWRIKAQDKYSAIKLLIYSCISKNKNIFIIAPSFEYIEDIIEHIKDYFIVSTFSTYKNNPYYINEWCNNIESKPQVIIGTILNIAFPVNNLGMFLYIDDGGIFTQRLLYESRIVLSPNFKSLLQNHYNIQEILYFRYKSLQDCTFIILNFGAKSLYFEYLIKVKKIIEIKSFSNLNNIKWVVYSKNTQIASFIDNNITFINLTDYNILLCYYCFKVIRCVFCNTVLRISKDNIINIYKCYNCYSSFQYPIPCLSCGYIVPYIKNLSLSKKYITINTLNKDIIKHKTKEAVLVHNTLFDDIRHVYFSLFFCSALDAMSQSLSDKAIVYIDKKWRNYNLEFFNQWSENNLNYIVDKILNRAYVLDIYPYKFNISLISSNYSKMLIIFSKLEQFFIDKYNCKVILKKDDKKINKQTNVSIQLTVDIIYRVMLLDYLFSLNLNIYISKYSKIPAVKMVIHNPYL